MLGLGLLGRGENDAKFLAECGAELIITDLKSKEDLAPTLAVLSKYKNIRYVLGEHRFEDFENRDFILKAAGVPLDSPYIAHAKECGIPIKMDSSWFAELVRGVTLIGITGTRGKSTVTHLIHHILKTADKSAYLGGNVKGMATLPYLLTAKEGDIYVLELDSWQLQGWGEAGISPHIAVFTNLLSDHLNYYMKGGISEEKAVEQYFADKANIFRNQKKGDMLVLNPDIEQIIASRHSVPLAGTVVVADLGKTKGWKTNLLGAHNTANIAQAVAVAEIFGVDMKTMQKALESFSGVEGRQQFLRELDGVKFYNDTTATTPDATIAALAALGSPRLKQIVLIMGGADKGLDMTKLVQTIPKYVSYTILLAGTGTEKLAGRIKGPVMQSLADAVQEAMRVAKKGSIVLLSPAFASFGMFKNEFDRGEQFAVIVSGMRGKAK